MDMKILQNEDLCYLKNSGIDQCCHISSFDFSIRVDRLSLYVFRGDFVFSVSDAVCSQSCTLIKRCGFCLRKARVPDTNSIISRLNVFVNKWKKKKLKTIKLQASTEGSEFNRI